MTTTVLTPATNCATIDTVTQLIWQTLHENELRLLSPSDFYFLTSDFGLTDDDWFEAWHCFSDRRFTMFGNNK